MTKNPIVLLLLSSIAVIVCIVLLQPAVVMKQYYHFRGQAASAMQPTTVYQVTDAQGRTSFSDQPDKGHKILVDTSKINHLDTPKTSNTESNQSHVTGFNPIGAINAENERFAKQMAAQKAAQTDF